MVSNRSNGSADPSEPESSASEAFDRLLKQVAELCVHVTYFFSAKTDSVRLLVQQAIMWVALGCVGVIAMGSVLATAVVLFLTGLAEGLTVAFAGQIWLGHIMAGFMTLVILGLGSLVWVRKWRQSSLRRTIQRYEQQQLQQQAAFGRSVADRAADIQK